MLTQLSISARTVSSSFLLLSLGATSHLDLRRKERERRERREREKREREEREREERDVDVVVSVLSLFLPVGNLWRPFISLSVCKALNFPLEGGREKKAGLDKARQKKVKHHSPLPPPPTHPPTKKLISQSGRRLQMGKTSRKKNERLQILVRCCHLQSGLYRAMLVTVPEVLATLICSTKAWQR